ncbi:O-antigen ligase family protein, partial [Patescibacteria group bacterium]|nr:O-antigen ligase family protein [Patescibacteria group bacterium]
FVVSVFAIYQKFTGAFIFNELWAAEETRRVTSFFGYPNAVGLYLGPIMLILLVWIFDQYSKIKSKNLRQDIKEIFNFQFSIFNQFFKIIFLFLTIIISLLSIYFAKSEGAMIGIAAGLLVFGLSAGKKIRWVVAALILLALIGIINFQPLRDYAVKKITLTDLSGEIRKQQWRETWQMLAASPLRFALGAGLANYQNAVAPYHQEGIFFNKDNDLEFYRHVVWNEEYKKSHWQPVEVYLYPHNIILNFWSELGLAGLLLFVWIIGKFFVIGIWNFFGNCLPRCAARGRGKLEIGNLETRKDKYLALGLLGAMTVIVIHGVVDVPYFKNDLAVMFWLLIAMMGLINLEKNYGENL